MLALTLAKYSLKRISRNRSLWVAMFALPLLFALVRCLFAGMAFSKQCLWICPVACLALIAGVLWVQMSMDRASGLVTGFKSAAVTERELLVSRCVAGAIVFAAQMLLMAAVLAAWF